jgi:hypothetical protein
VAGFSVRASTRDITAGASPNANDKLRAIVRALNKTAQQARTGAPREVCKAGYNIEASATKRSFTVECATPSNFAVTLRANGAPVPLIN